MEALIKRVESYLADCWDDDDAGWVGSELSDAQGAVERLREALQDRRGEGLDVVQRGGDVQGASRPERTVAEREASREAFLEAYGWSNAREGE